MNIKRVKLETQLRKNLLEVAASTLGASDEEIRKARRLFPQLRNSNGVWNFAVELVSPRSPSSASAHQIP